MRLEAKDTAPAFTLLDADEKPHSLKDFKGTYERSGPNRGTPRTYEAAITYSVGADGEEKATTVKVNEPLDIDGSKVYLTAHGYAPSATHSSRPTPQARQTQKPSHRTPQPQQTSSTTHASPVPKRAHPLFGDGIFNWP